MIDAILITGAPQYLISVIDEHVEHLIVEPKTVIIAAVEIERVYGVVIILEEAVRVMVIYG